MSKVYKETGLLRKYDNERHEWKTCTQAEEQKYNKELKSADIGKKKLAESEIEQSLYGRLKGDKLYIVYRGNTSSRTGVTCNKKTAIPAIIELGGVNVTNMHPYETKEELVKRVKRIRTHKSLIENIEDRDANYIRNIILLSGYGETKLCDILKRMFASKELLLNE